MLGTGLKVHDWPRERKECDCSAYGDMRPGAVHLKVTVESKRTWSEHGSSSGGEERLIELLRPAKYGTAVLSSIKPVCVDVSQDGE